MDETNKKLLAYLDANRYASAGELAELVGLTIPSVRYRIFQLMAAGLVRQKKTADHRVWFFVTEKSGWPIEEGFARGQGVHNRD
ncbi:MAG: winged helix-turn-helix domain-containing protein [Halobacteriota archaeon]